jgi:hypothetical protein
MPSPRRRGESGESAEQGKKRTVPSALPPCSPRTWTTTPSPKSSGRGILYVPTIDHNRYYADNFQLLRYPPEAVERLNIFI